MQTRLLDLFNEFHFQNDKVVKTDEKCCKKQDLINYNGLNVCRQCGQVINYEFVPGYCHATPVVNLTLSYNEIDEFYRFFQTVEHQMVQMKIKRFVKFN